MTRVDTGTRVMIQGMIYIYVYIYVYICVYILCSLNYIHLDNTLHMKYLLGRAGNWLTKSSSCFISIIKTNWFTTVFLFLFFFFSL